jgi:hypothetical protein
MEVKHKIPSHKHVHLFLLIAECYTVAKLTHKINLHNQQALSSIVELLSLVLLSGLYYP